MRNALWTEMTWKPRGVIMLIPIPIPMRHNHGSGSEGDSSTQKLKHM